MHSTIILDHEGTKQLTRPLDVLLLLPLEVQVYKGDNLVANWNEIVFDALGYQRLTTN